RALALDLRRLDGGLRRELRAAYVGLGNGARGFLRGKFDDAGFFRSFNLALSLDVDNLAGLLAGDALLLELQFGGDARPLDAFAPCDVGGFDRLVTRYLLGARGKLGLDPLGRDTLLAGDA